jgi:DNA-binding response OmpR family regulator
MPEANQPRILIADDREENRYVLCRVLSGAGYECLEAGTGKEALDIAQTLPDVIILDVHLPDISGYDVCRRIKENPQTASISILQISASFVSTEDRVHALDVGADGYLTHPIDRLVLLATVRALLRLRAAETIARKAAEQWQSTFNALAEGLALVNTNGRIVRWNEAFAEICGPDFRPQAGEDASQFLNKVLRTRDLFRLDSREHVGQEFVIGQRTVQLTVGRVEPQSEDSDRILILFDMTDHKIAEEAQRTAEKLAAIGKLSNSIAHGINNPLEALVNLIYLASRSESLGEIQDFLGKASEALDRVAEITRQTLSFYRSPHPAVSSLAKEDAAPQKGGDAGGLKADEA